MRLPPQTREVLPALVIAGALAWSYTEHRPQSGVVVRVVADGKPAGGYVRVTKPKLHSTLAGGRIPRAESIRYRLQPGAYMIRPGARPGHRADPIAIQIREDRFDAVTVRYRRVRPARP